ncbi:hypothetical protein WJX81_005990 [Elliptochloris bilobata]|uniref:Uncharacterized protein n=1 Tax=Elliptochloris bilobata TaxID=381761 RepID=A0AAW1QD14_9CHLO
MRARYRTASWASGRERPVMDGSAAVESGCAGCGALCADAPEPAPQQAGRSDAAAGDWDALLLQPGAALPSAGDLAAALQATSFFIGKPCFGSAGAALAPAPAPHFDIAAFGGFGAWRSAAGAPADANTAAAASAGATALHAAAGSGHLAIVERLLEAGADADAQAQNGATALHHAASCGHVAIAEKLLAAGADADVQNSSGNTALHLAAAKGHVEVLDALVGAGADAGVRSSRGWAAVHSAAAAGQLEAVLRLVAAGAALRGRQELDIMRLLTRKTSYKRTYVEGRLRLAEKERQRAKLRTGAAGVIGSAPSLSRRAREELAAKDKPAPQSEEERAAAEAQANAAMAELLAQEAVEQEAAQEQEQKRRAKKKDKKKRREQRAGKPDARPRR